MKAKGKPQYTQYSVAFPTSLVGNEHERIGVEFNARGGGCYGSGVTFTWHRFESGNKLGLEVSGWGDGLFNLTDDRIQRVLAKLTKAQRARDRKSPWGYSTAEATPAEVIAALEAEGITASKYHLEGAAR